MNFSKQDLLEIEIVRLERVLEKAYELLSDVDVVGTSYSELRYFDLDSINDLERFKKFMESK